MRPVLPISGADPSVVRRGHPTSSHCFSFCLKTSPVYFECNHSRFLQSFTLLPVPTFCKGFTLLSGPPSARLSLVGHHLNAMFSESHVVATALVLASTVVSSPLRARNIEFSEPACNSFIPVGCCLDSTDTRALPHSYGNGLGFANMTIEFCQSVCKVCYSSPVLDANS